MSWRAIFAILLVALGVSTLAGIRFGDWLVAHAPPAGPASAQAAIQEPVLDADGRPYTAQPPQPRVDGTLGVPDPHVATNWKVNTVSLFDGPRNPLVSISRYRNSPSEPRRAADAPRGSGGGGGTGGSPAPRGGATGATVARSLDLDTQRARTQQSAEQTEPIPAPRRAADQTLVQSIDMAPARSAAAANNAGGWQDSLRRELAQCAKRGFFDRPTCSWNARNRYCGPNQAWGTIPQCPRKVE